MAKANARDGAGSEYTFGGASPAHNHRFLVPGILKILGPSAGRRLLDLGCGNGSLTNALSLAGFQVVGVDSSDSGIAQAREAFPDVLFEQHDLALPLPPRLGRGFDVVLAAEVIEHLFLPRELFTRASEGIAPAGELVLTTPFHGYWKNLAIAATNGFDHHWRPGWDHGHIKFFSVRSLGEMSVECGFQPNAWGRVGRVPQLAKSMIMRAGPLAGCSAAQKGAVVAGGPQG